ncbi:hypothetical protein MODO_1871 [Myroides odoratimimus]|uniref:Uncharacterized protein n=1 Tax=Myroides odoratimimus CCUG 10230 TaxID=883150 RepID=A0ABP2N6E3_9FLAO|nr:MULTISPECIES: hypothetical protein [Myroides]AJA67603.1 hypothetical protein MYRA21_0393 [Myroides sp. A21]EHO05772.1 hypothetical protein HMPREF9712_03348 [Myroides odoratimimus CCUG 10230]MDM1085015.1 hypothetical protein [Myroides odoratimimus]MDM1457094.1 hypothetical protein [Myroides odoratimimus]MDM1512270.1 hypothetical protein [Myroides odoratimimus]
MERQIKLIWDFKGPAGEKTAEHHVIHLKEYVAIEQLPIFIIDYTVLAPEHTIAYMVVNDEQMRQLRDILKPHRGELYE